MRIRPARGLNHNLSFNANWLINNYSNLAFLLVDNNPIAVLNPPENISSLNTVTVEVNEKIPLWKQSIDMQMGKVPKNHRTSNRTMYFKILNFDSVRRFTYSVYECY